MRAQKVVNGKFPSTNNYKIQFDDKNFFILVLVPLTECKILMVNLIFKKD